MSEPIGVKPGVYTTNGQDVMGLCLILDDAEARWSVIEEENDSISINIPSDSLWKVMRVQDKDKPGSSYLQVFRVNGELNALVLQSFVHPTEDVHTPNGNHHPSQPPEVKIFYTAPPAVTNEVAAAMMQGEMK